MVKERRQRVYGALFLIVLVIVLGRGPVLGAIGRVGHMIGLPFWRTANVIEDGTGGMRDLTRSRDSLLQENKALRDQIELSDLQSKTFNALIAENLHLKELMGRSDEAQTILARVLSRPPFEVYDTFVIDVGADKGIVPGALVYGKGAFVIGSISRVMDTTAVVTLASAPGEMHTAMIAESDPLAPISASSSTTLSEDHELVFTGIGGGGFRAQVPKQLSIATGTMMALPTFAPSYLGSISGEYVPENGSLKEVYGALPFGINSLEWVKVALSASTSTMP